MIVYHGRWQDTLPGSYEPATSVVVTDPPYGLGTDAGKGYADDVPWAQHVAEVLELLPAVRHVIRGPASAVMRRDYPEPRRMCVEVAKFRRRAAYRPGVVPYLWQGWVVYGRLAIGDPSGMLSGDAIEYHPYSVARMSAKSDHRALTPMTVASWIIGQWVDRGYTVVDPFAGYGTIGEAARARGHDYVGSEISVEYVSRAWAMIDNETRPLWDAV